MKEPQPDAGLLWRNARPRFFIYLRSPDSAYEAIKASSSRELQPAGVLEWKSSVCLPNGYPAI